MVKTGILRTFGEALRSWLATRLSNRFAGFAAGMGLAMLLQSSTAASLLVASLQAGGLVSTAAALAAVLGADLGSALAARILTLNISSLIPILLIAGTFLFLRRMEKREGQFGRMLLGFAFVLLALQSIMASTQPMRDSPIILETLAHLPEHPFLAAAVGIVCAVLFFSSLAVVAVTAAATASGLLPASAALWVVLGANFGSALLAAAATAGASKAARKAPLGNFFFRVGGFAAGAAVLYFIPAAGSVFASLGDPADGVILFHVVYNTVIGAVGLSFIHPAAALIDRLVPVSIQTDDFETHLLSKENLLSSSSALVQVRHENARTAELFRKHWDASLRLSMKIRRWVSSWPLKSAESSWTAAAAPSLKRSTSSSVTTFRKRPSSNGSRFLPFLMHCSSRLKSQTISLICCGRKKSAARSFSVHRVRRNSNKSITSYLRT